MKNVVNERRRRRELAHQEHDDDGDQRDGDADFVGGSPFLTVRPDDRLPLRHDLAKLLTLAHRMDQERIEDDEQRQWQQHLVVGGPIISTFAII